MRAQKTAIIIAVLLFISLLKADSSVTPTSSIEFNHVKSCAASNDSPALSFALKNQPSGCCATQGGICACDGIKVVCCDGQPSAIYCDCY